jgi:hypothetical protein
MLRLSGRVLRLEPSVYANLKSAQHPAHPLAVEFQLSTTATFLLLRGPLLGLALLAVLAPHPKNNTGLAAVFLMPLRRHLLARFSANHLPIKTKRVSPLPQHPHGAKSGLATNTK